MSERITESFPRELPGEPAVALTVRFVEGSMNGEITTYVGADGYLYEKRVRQTGTEWWVIGREG